MLTEYETQKLRHEMRGELSAAPIVVVRCVAMILLVFGLAWLGTSCQAPASADLRASDVMPRPEPVSKAVFEQRRERFIEAFPDSQVAREARAHEQKDAHADGGYFAYASQ